jgi:hypothetical protein
MSLLTTEADAAATTHAELARSRPTKREKGVSVARELTLGLLIALLVVCALSCLLMLEPSAPSVELPRPNPRPKLLDQPYRPNVPAAR